MKIKVGLVQPNFTVGYKKENSYYLPYSVGILWSYANSFTDIQNNYVLNNVVFKRDKVKKVAKELAKNDIVAFSTYIWNRNYNYALAKLIKEINPQTFILFGGPEPAITDTEFFVKHPYIDAVAMLEGEDTFVDILRFFRNPDVYHGIPGLYTPLQKNEMRPRLTNFKIESSPYLSGFFDKIVLDNPDCNWIATLETNRGCPYQCTFCDWGSLTYAKIKNFEVDRVISEIEWISKNKCIGLFIADANFGTFIQRDEIFLDKIIEVTKTTGYPKFFSLNWAKNQKEYVVQMAKKWIDAKIRAPALTVSLQTLEPQVLKNIKRTNMDINRITELFTLCEQQEVPVITDLILGLPGETLSGWKNNYYKLFAAGNHHGIQVHQSQILENAEMNLKQKEEFNLVTVLTNDYMTEFGKEEIREGIEIVVASNTMSSNDMLDAAIFNWFINTTHVSGTTSIISRFLNKYKNISYEDFYNSLFEFLKTKKLIKDELKIITKCFKDWLTIGKIKHKDILDNKINGQNLVRASKMKWYATNKIHDYMELIHEHLKTYNLPNDMCDQLFSLQYNKVVDYNLIKQYPKKQNYNYDFMNYIMYDTDLKQNTTYEFYYPEDEDTDISLSAFVAQIHLGRNREFATTKIRIL